MVSLSPDPLPLTPLPGTLLAGLGEHDKAYYTLDRLHEVIHRENLINYFEEEDQDLDKVLSIFIRVNSGGTVLSHSDMLLSIATAQWRDLDAREVIHSFVDDLNQTGQGFTFSKDLVLKAGLVLTDINDIRFKVTNFNSVNMSTLESQWVSSTAFSSDEHRTRAARSMTLTRRGLSY